MGQLRSQKASEALTAMVARHTIEAVSQLLFRFLYLFNHRHQATLPSGVVALHLLGMGRIQFFVCVSDSLRV